MDANQNKASNLAGQMASDIPEEAQRLRQEQQKAQQSIGEGSDLSKQYKHTAAGTDTINTIGNKAYTTGQLDEGDESSYFGYLKPQKFDFQTPQLQSQIRQAQDVERRAKGLTTEQGRYEELQKMFGQSGDYSRGQSRLDQMLFPRTQAAKSAIRNTRKATQGLSKVLQGVQQIGQGMKGRILSEQPRLAKLAYDKAMGARGKIEDAAKARYDEREQMLQEAFGTGKQNMETGAYEQTYNVDPNLLSKMGVDEGTVLFGLNPLEYMNPNRDFRSVMGKQDVAKANLLTRLATENEGKLAGTQYFNQKDFGRDLNVRAKDYINAEQKLNRARQEAEAENRYYDSIHNWGSGPRGASEERMRAWGREIGNQQSRLNRLGGQKLKTINYGDIDLQLGNKVDDYGSWKGGALAGARGRLGREGSNNWFSKAGNWLGNIPVLEEIPGWTDTMDTAGNTVSAIHNGGDTDWRTQDYRLKKSSEHSNDPVWGINPYSGQHDINYNPQSEEDNLLLDELGYSYMG